MKLIPEQVQLLEKELLKLNDTRSLLIEQKEYQNSYISCDGEGSGVRGDEKEEIQRSYNRIKEIESLLKYCEILPTPCSDTITLGSYFTVEINFSEDESEVFNGYLVEEMVTTEDSQSFFSTKSYLGKSLLGKRKNDNISWQLPDGGIVSGTVLAVKKDNPKVKNK